MGFKLQVLVEPKDETYCGGCKLLDEFGPLASDPPWCLLGAIQAVFEDKPLYCILQQIATFIGVPSSSLRSSITTWNDQSGRTKEEVIAMLRGAAEYARKRGV